MLIDSNRWNLVEKHEFNGNIYIEYQDEDGYFHLVKDGIDLFADKRIVRFDFYLKHIETYDLDGYIYLFYNDIDLLDNRSVVKIFWFSLSNEKQLVYYTDNKGYIYEFNNGIDKILVNEVVLDFKVWDNGYYGYQDRNGYWHFIKDNKDLFQNEKVMNLHFHEYPYYSYKDSEGKWHHINMETGKENKFSSKIKGFLEKI